MKITTIVLKIASRCNINCTYCYMYNHEDQSYKKLPKFFSIENVDYLKLRIKKHCFENKIDSFFIIFHGGEPLLYGKELFKNFFSQMKDLENDNIRIAYAMQTNGVLIDKEFCEIFNEFNVGLGISLDGAKEINDVNRLDKKGVGTFDKVVEGINTANKYLKNPLGCLSVVNVNTSPIETYNTYESLGFKSIDFLMLDETHNSIKFTKETPNADWLIELFDYWYNLPSNKRLRIRKFESIISYILGNGENVDTLGSGKNEVLVVETDGGFEPVDVLKICGESFTKLGLNVRNNEISDVFKSPLVKLYYNSGTLLPKKCLACPVQDVCGGGYLPHRYSSHNGFNNPSVYCSDLLKIITHIQNKILDDVPFEIIQETGIEKLTYVNALKIIEENLSNVQEPEYVELLEYFRKEEYA